VGKKLAERIIVELKDKLEETEFAGALTPGIEENEKISEVKQALRTLGYNSREINKIVEKISIEDIENKKTEEILRLDLKEV
jgi:Holliday junction DNA helicase RuvA